MIIEMIVAFLLGACCGLVFRVWVLVPLGAVALIAVPAANMYSGASFGVAMMAGVAALISTQIGYAVGLVLHRSASSGRSPGKPPFKIDPHCV